MIGTTKSRVRKIAAGLLTLFATLCATQFTVHAQSVPFAITSPSTLPAADVCVASTTRICRPYSFTFTTNAGQPNVVVTPPITWSLPSSTVPAGLTLNQNTGVLGGIIVDSLVVGRQSFYVEAIDAAEHTTGFFSNLVNLPVNPQLSINTASLPNAYQGFPYSPVTLTASGGTAPYTWSAVTGSLPPGFALSSEGVLTAPAAGPTTFGSYQVSVQVTDSAGGDSGATTVTATLPLFIVEALHQTSPATLPTAEAGAPYSFTFAASGGSPTYTWSISSNAPPPPGLILNAFGVLSGVPTTPGTYAFSNTVSDITPNPPGPEFSTQPVSILVVPHVAIATTSLPAGSAGVPYSSNLQAAGGIGPYTWSATGLPSGLLLSSAGVLSGTPGAPSTSNVEITITDSATPAQTATHTFVVDIATQSTTTSITASPTAAKLGQVVTLTASVSPPGAIGIVSFSTGGIQIGTAVLSPSGSATLNSRLLPSGTDAIRVTYSGDTTHSTSTSVPTTVTVNAAPASSFRLNTTFSDGLALDDLDAGDFDNDGIADLVVLTNGTSPDFQGSVTVLLGKGDGTFNVGGTYSVGIAPSSAKMADLNGDGALDLVVANSGAIGSSSGLGSISVLLGNGHGSFQQSSTLAAETNPRLLIIADLNMDEKPDLAVIDDSTQTLNILLGNGDGTFKNPESYPVDAGATSISVSDLNVDSFPDLVITNSVAATISVYLGNGDGTLQDAKAYAVGTEPIASAVADYNNDGKLDIAVANQGSADIDNGSSSVSILLGNGDGTFNPAQPYPADHYAQSIAVGDFNGDNKPDLVVLGGSPSDTVNVLLGNGDGSFQRPMQYAAGSNPFSVIVEDFDGDGRTDLAIANYSQGGVTILSGVGPPANISVQSGNSQVALTGTSFSSPLVVAVKDSSGNPIPGVSVTFTAPSSGSSITFPGPTTTATTQTDAQGVATSPAFSANDVSGSFNVSVSVGGSQVSASFTLTNIAPLIITTTEVPNGVFQEAYAATALLAQGGIPPYSWVGTGLPAGVNLSSAGVLSGTPTVPGTFPVTVNVSDSSLPAQSAHQQLTVTVLSPLTIRTSTLPSGKLGSPYSASILAQGGTLPYVWSVSSGSLPPGLILQPASGALTGNPMGFGTYTFTIALRDASTPSQSVSQGYSVTITSGLQITSTPPNGVAGTPYETRMTAEGGTPPYSWTLASGSLPNGIVLNAVTGVLSGTPTAAGSFSFSIKITDASVPAPQSSIRPTTLTLSPPQASFTVPGVQAPGQAMNVGLSLAQPTAAALQGTVTIAFQPNAAGVDPDYIDPAVQFISTPGGQQTYTFTAGAGTQSITLPQVQPGTVAGTLTITANLAGQTAATSQVVIDRIPPIIDSAGVQITNLTSNGFDVEVTANSTPRDLQTITFIFNSAKGTKIDGNATFTIDVSAQVSAWYTNPTSQQFGSRLLLTVPFTFSGSQDAIGSVTVNLKNSVGTSASVTGGR